MRRSSGKTSTAARRADVVRCTPTLEVERRLCGSGRVVAGMDEVGRGAWAGPVVVGVVVVDVGAGELPVGVRDSKALTAAARTALAPAIRSWCTAWSLGEATPREIDRLGIMGALTVAAHRALLALAVRPDVLFLDGSIDFVSGGVRAADGAPSPRDWARPRRDLEVRTQVRADATIGTVAAAAILAKVARDAAMVRLGGRVADYGFDQHKGYGTRAHEDAIRAHGLSAHHRRSWGFVDRLEAADAP